jgi:hypothetical protein
MSDFSSSDREVIRFLFSKRDWIDLYDLHVEFGLSPAQVLDMLERLLAVGLAERQGAQARLTPQGRDWVLAARGEIFFVTDSKIWRPSSEQLLADAIEPSTPYLPDLGLVDRDFFVQLALGKKSDDDTG